MKFQQKPAPVPEPAGCGEKYKTGTGTGRFSKFHNRYTSTYTTTATTSIHPRIILPLKMNEEKPEIIIPVDQTTDKEILKYLDEYEKKYPRNENKKQQQRVLLFI